MLFVYWLQAGSLSSTFCNKLNYNSPIRRHVSLVVDIYALKVKVLSAIRNHKIEGRRLHNVGYIRVYWRYSEYTKLWIYSSWYTGWGGGGWLREANSLGLVSLSCWRKVNSSPRRFPAQSLIFSGCPSLYTKKGLVFSLYMSD